MISSPTAANAYLEYLYSNEGQDIAGRNYYRPASDKAAARYSKVFAKTPTLITIVDFGGWTQVQARHFDDDGVFDKIYSPQ